ncbi:MAG: hypothetical protein ABIP94_06200, partial [Planctomycetota bacterium]
MRDLRPDEAEAAQVAAATDSHGSAKKPSRQRTFLPAAGKEQKPLDVCAAVPLHVRPVLNGY